jgi:xylulokinase
MSYLGLDVGTSGCKAVVFGDDGRELASAYREHTILAPREGWAELDSQQVVDGCLGVVKEAASACTHNPVRALGVSSQGEAITPVDRDGKVLGNAMVSFDTRAAAIAEDWSREFGRERLYEITGHTAHPMFTLFKLLWLRDNRPDVWHRASHFYCFEELIHHQLGIEPAISWPLAGRTMIFNVRTHQWQDEILSAIGLKRAKLARTLPSGTIVGTVSPSVARGLGLQRNVLVVAGGHDQPCGALGAGIVTAGKAMYATGTVECVCPAFSAPVFSQALFESNLCTYDYTVPGMYTTIAFSLTGGNLLRWFRDQWGQREVEEAARTGKDAYELVLQGMADRPTSLMVLPYFGPTGTPHFDSRGRGALLGLRLTTQRSDVLRALLEGVAFEVRLNIDILNRSGIAIDELRATGRGARSRRWTQLKADVLNRPISSLAVTEAGCLGVAMLARIAHTGGDLEGLVREWSRVTEVVEPNPENAAYYESRFPAYLSLYPTLKGLMQ